LLSLPCPDTLSYQTFKSDEPPLFGRADTTVPLWSLDLTGITCTIPGLPPDTARLCFTTPSGLPLANPNTVYCLLRGCCSLVTARLTQVFCPFFAQALIPLPFAIRGFSRPPFVLSCKSILQDDYGLSTHNAALLPFPFPMR